MRVDPRSVIYPGIRAAYDLPRVTQELTRLLGQRFRLQDLSAGFFTAMGIAADDPTIEMLRKGWMTLDDLDAITSRPLEVRSVVLALYYSDLLEREPIAEQPNPRTPRFRGRFTCRNPPTWARFSNSPETPAPAARRCRASLRRPRSPRLHPPNLVGR
jgi:hypothetical protein